VDTTVKLADGFNTLVIKAWDTSGAMQRTDLKVSTGSANVGGDGSVTFSNIDELADWGSCDSCAGFNGEGPTTPYSMSRVSSPSLDGKSAKFWLGGDTPYARALWWKSLTRDYTRINNAKHFILDTFFYYTNPKAPYALEFTVTQYVNGRKLNFGMQCNILGGGVWDVSTGNNPTWRHTAIPCVPPTYKWNHVVMEFERMSDYRLRYVSITFNGEKHYIDQYYAPRSTSSTNLTFHYQMDGNKTMTDYTTYLDEVTVKMW
jgi:hypothetical protein